jgi:hypothetical protein
MENLWASARHRVVEDGIETGGDHAKKRAVRGSQLAKGQLTPKKF